MPTTIDLTRLAEVTGLSAGTAAAYSEAAAVCLELQSHNSGVLLRVHGAVTGTPSLLWQEIDDVVRANHADHQDATEFGATAVALHVTASMTDWRVHQRSVKSTGFDYWLGKADRPVGGLFQNACRFEVSGILRGTANQVSRRLSEKIKQSNTSATHLPVVVAIVEFGVPQTLVHMT